jgi:hypothetical protein
MKLFSLCCALVLCAGFFARGQITSSATLDTIGLTALRQQDPSLTGSGVVLMQIESAPAPLAFEVDPGSPGQPVSLFTYGSTSGIAVTFPNRVGSESSHADDVAEDLFGANTGMAPGLLRVFNFETDYFYRTVILADAPVRPLIFNQSFEFGDHNAAQDQAYDNYIALHHTVVASGIGNGGPILTPADCYNGIGVAAYGGGSSTGPTADGRCKPDITAPATATSFSTPLVSGAAAILLQAGSRLGVNAAAAVDSRTIKALLLTGAEKPAGWTHTITAPLDPNYGAGILNILNSWAELEGGRHPPTSAELVSLRLNHPPLAQGASITASQGWDSRAITSTAVDEGVNHYSITASATGSLITTLVWNKPFNTTRINQLYLYVYNAAGTLLASSRSTIDNLQHVYLTGLTPGAYEIQVVKRAGLPGTLGVVTERDAYALAWDFGR